MLSTTSGKEEIISKNTIISDGYVEISKDVFINANNIAFLFESLSYVIIPLQQVSMCRIERGINKYNLYIHSSETKLCICDTLEKIQKVAETISLSISNITGQRFSVITGNMQPNIKEVLHLSEFSDAIMDSSCTSYLIWPFVMLSYYIVCPIINIFLRLLIK